MNLNEKIHVEIVIKKKEDFNLDKLKTKLDSLVQQIALTSLQNATLSLIKEAELEDYVISLSVDKPLMAPIDINNISYHPYIPCNRESELETLSNDEEGEEIPSSYHLLLPYKGYVGLWENLIYEDGLKEKILKFAESSLKFAQHKVDHNVISCNRLILLHGPPGTGKSSLCKALAQKLSIRLNNTYKYTHLIEINSHSLFSKWFSESGKLVMKLFLQIKDILSHSSSLVCVLIDEIESLAYSRSSMSGQEPKDAMRVVNALLTQLDSLKYYSNLIVLATSNLASSIDLALIDRADVKQYIGLPTVNAIYKIYTSMLTELMEVNIIEKSEIPSFDEDGTYKLVSLSKQSANLSGRALRKIPFLAHAMFLPHSNGIFTLDQFFDAIAKALDKYVSDETLLGCNSINSI